MRLHLHRRLKLGTDRAADWPGVTEEKRSRPRVLLEVRDAAEAMSYWRFLGDLGYQISWCPGPTASSSCALVTDGHCPLVESADIVLTALNPEDDDARPVLERHRQDPVRPTIAVAPVTGAKRWSTLYDRFHVLDPFQVRWNLPPALAAAEIGCRDVSSAPGGGPILVRSGKALRLYIRAALPNAERR